MFSPDFNFSLKPNYVYDFIIIFFRRSLFIFFSAFFFVENFPGIIIREII